MRRSTLCRAAAVAAACLIAVPGGPAAAAPLRILAWAPGQPGTREQAQPTMDAFAAEIARRTGRDPGSVSVTYEPDLDAGAAAAAEADLLLIPLPLYLERGRALALEPLLEVVQEPGPDEAWTLVARKGAVRGPASLAGWSIVGAPGYSERFVRRVALAGWGALPDDVAIEPAPRVLSALRRAAKGEPVAVLLDRAETKALDALPFAAELETVATSAPMPAMLLARVDSAAAGAVPAVVEALAGLDDGAGGEELLHELRVVRFARLEPGKLAPIERAFAGATPASP